MPGEQYGSDEPDYEPDFKPKREGYYQSHIRPTCDIPERSEALLLRDVLRRPLPEFAGVSLLVLFCLSFWSWLKRL